VLATVDGHPVAIRDGRVLACSFHPELTDDLRVHALLMAMATAARGERRAPEATAAEDDSPKR
jgi:5'-phosphate synthase pdxT subunit